MSKLSSSLSLSVFFVLVLVAPSAQAAGPCDFVFGPAQPTAFATDFQTGLIVFKLPVTIGTRTYTADLTIALLGILEVAADGTPLRAVSAHSWRIRANGLRLEWFGETLTTPTDVPGVVHYAVRLELAHASKHFGEGLMFVEGEFNLLDGSGNAANLFGKLCVVDDDD